MYWRRCRGSLAIRFGILSERDLWANATIMYLACISVSDSNPRCLQALSQVRLPLMIASVEAERIRKKAAKMRLEEC